MLKTRDVATKQLSTIRPHRQAPGRWMASMMLIRSRVSRPHPMNDHDVFHRCGMCRHSSSDTPVSSSTPPLSNSRQASYPFRINEAAQLGNTTLAESLLKEMHEEYNRTRNETLKPQILVFSMILNAWAKSGSKQAPQRAEGILEKMWELHEKHEFDTKPDVVSYSSVMSCWARSGQNGAAERAEALLREMQARWKDGEVGLRPNSISYTTVMHAYARRGEAEKAEALLEEMHFDHSVNGNEAAKPTVISFSTVLDAWSKCKSKHSPQRAEKMLLKMWKLYESGKLDDPPSNFCYNCTITTWANSKDLNASQKAVALLREMQERWENGEEGLRPTVVSYNAVIHAFAKRGQADKAESLFEEIYTDYESKGNEGAI